MPAVPNYLTPDEAADRLRVTGRTIRRWVADGKLRAVTLPSGRIRIPEEALDEFAELPPTEPEAAAS